MASPTLEQHPQTRPIPTHEHGWATESTHATSEGMLRYVRCVGCGSRRVDLTPIASAPLHATSIVVDA